jgi:hypothetical protein
MPDDVVYDRVNVRNIRLLSDLTGKWFSELFEIFRKADLKTEYIDFYYPSGRPDLAVFRDSKGDDITLPNP